MLERLLNQTGNARQILGLPVTGAVDLSSEPWATELEIIRGIQFDDVLIAKTKFLTEFVGCQFDHCRFQRIVCDSHFIGSENRWTDCEFTDCRLGDLIAPRNRFEGCRFERVSIEGFALCQTLFSGCQFEQVTFKGLLTRKIAHGFNEWAEIHAQGANALFERCVFDRTLFSGCNLAGVCFDQCQIPGSQFKHCALEGVIGRESWFAEFKPDDPFVAFLDAVLAAIAKKFGQQSQSFQAMAQYRLGYLNQERSRMDYAKVLYAGTVPEKELTAVEKLLDKVESSFSF